MTLGSELEGRDNALNFVRLVLAALVIVIHAGIWGIGVPDLRGNLPVGGFFAISGYLIAGSRVRLPLTRFLWRRSVRILPAFWVCLAVIAFLFAPVGAALEHTRWDVGSALGYVINNAALYMFQPSVGTTLATTNNHAWNGSLWTLCYEFGAYLACGILFTWRWARTIPFVGLLLVGLTTLNLIARPILDITTNLYLNGMWLAGFFVAGMFWWVLRDRVVVRWWLVALAAAALWIVLAADQFQTLAALPLGFLVLAAGARLRTRVGAVNDISYGVYIYAFPVQQIIAILGWGPRLGLLLAAALTLAVTVPLAWASWRFVERPAIDLGRLRRNDLATLLRPRQDSNLRHPL